MKPVTDVVAWIADLGIPGYGGDEVAFMAGTLARSQADYVFEWGTNRGSSGRIFWEAARVYGVECEIHTVELPLELAYRDRDHPGQQAGLFLAETTVRQHRGDGLEVSLRLYFEAQPKRPLFYLDGCHDYEQVLVELRTLSTAAPEAVLLLHDTRHLPSVADALRQFKPERRYEVEHLSSEAGMTALWPRRPA